MLSKHQTRQLKEGKSITVEEALEILEAQLDEDEKKVLEGFKITLQQLRKGKLLEAVGEEPDEETV